jgi:hypothetical protein
MCIKLPARLEPVLFAFLLSGAKSRLVSSMAVIRHVGWVDGVLNLCVQTWLPAWGMAFFAAMIFAPVIRKLTRYCCVKE